ncbi:MAG: methyltransferase domain-containing protein [Acidimicrobiia bacterium]|nr:methyltransferase domain-containing protein [Acidimicrobiia bacterium]
MGDWSELGEWWLEEVDDPAYAEEVLPLTMRTLQPGAGRLYLDLGCGQGRLMHAVAATGAFVIGIDVNHRLLADAAMSGSVVEANLPSLDYLASDAVDGAYVVLALEHIHDVEALFAGAARVVRTGGVLAAVLNHPVYTAPDSGPVLDQADGEIYWRFGGYFGRGSTHEPAGDGTVEFVHRSTSKLLNTAARHGWCLSFMEERPVSRGEATRDPLLAKHGDIPHLMAVRWHLHPKGQARGIVI